MFWRLSTWARACDDERWPILYRGANTRTCLWQRPRWPILFPEPKPELTSDNDQGDLFQSTGHHENSLVVMSWVTYFTPRANVTLLVTKRRVAYFTPRANTGPCLWRKVGWPILLRGPTLDLACDEEPALAASNARKTWKGNRKISSWINLEDKNQDWTLGTGSMSGYI